MKSLIIDNSASLHLNNNNVIIENDKGAFQESLDVIDIIIINQKTTLSTSLINEIVSKDIPIVINNDSKMPNAYIYPVYGSVSRFKTINDQFNWDKKKKNEVALKIITNKISNQEKTIEILFHKKHAYQDYLNDINATNMEKNEAFVARKYFYALFGSGFNRRDWSNEINKKLNYGYAIFASLITNQIVSHGYLTEIGIHHRSKTNNYNLTYDIIEPFRPIVDKYVFLTKDVKFDNAYKKELVNLVYTSVKYRNKEYTVINAIKEYVLDILKSLSSNHDIGSIDIVT